MLLAVDIGNSRIKFGVFDHEKLLSKVSIPTTRDITSQAIAQVLKDKLPGGIDSAIVCSVVPGANDAVRRFVTSAAGTEPVMVANDMDFGLSVAHEPLEDAGADRLVNAFSAVEKYGVPCLVCSFGTALSIDHVSPQREMTGGLIGPGMNTLARALKDSTARLPEVEIQKPEKILQNNTVGAMQSGIVLGYLAMVEGLLTKIKNEVGDSKVIATGGFAAMIAENTNLIDVVDSDLTLDGLRMLYLRLNK